MRRLIRLFVLLATFGVAWLALGEARAYAGVSRGAPWCDPRGATGFAPPPQLQDPLQSLDVAMNDADCTESPLEVRHVLPDHSAPRVDLSSSQEPAARRGAASAAPEAGAGPRLPAPVACDVGARPGFRSTVDWPPRA